MFFLHDLHYLFSVIRPGKDIGNRSLCDKGGENISTQRKHTKGEKNESGAKKIERLATGIPYAIPAAVLAT